MKREKRYLVFKLSDIKQYFDFSDQAVLSALACHIDDRRNADGRPDLEALVVESDWPEYEPTWAAIEARVDEEAAVEVDNKHYCDAGKWWQVVPQADRSFRVEVGLHDITLESDTFTHRGAAYKQKDRWLTKHSMFCPG